MNKVTRLQPLVILPRPDRGDGAPLPQGMTRDEAIEHAGALIAAHMNGVPPPTKGAAIDRRALEYLRAEAERLETEIKAVSGAPSGSA